MVVVWHRIGMDLDSFIAVREPRWQRLEQLAKLRGMPGAAADEFAQLYQLTATDLSQVRAAAPDPQLISRLSILLANARTHLAGANQPMWKQIARFFARDLPLSLYRLRWPTVGVTIAFVAIAIATAVYISNEPGALDQVGSFEARQDYANTQFESYYSQYPSSSFFARVWTNNSWVVLQSVGGGFTGIFTVWVQYANAASTGTAAAIMYEFGYLGLFFKLIMPHGLLELTAIWISGAAGLRIFWSLMVPGERKRMDAIAAEGRMLIGVALGLVAVLMAAGLMEGFVTGSRLPWLAKDAIGVLVLAGFWTYVIYFGRIAAREGFTGDIDADAAGDYVPVAG